MSTDQASQSAAVAADTFIDLLPSKLSDLISLVVQDVMSVNGDPAYRWDMSDWVHPGFEVIADAYPKPVCYVCIAAAVMVRRLPIDTQTDYAPYILPEPTQSRLIAIDYVRVGELFLATQSFSDDIAVRDRADALPAAATLRALYKSRSRDDLDVDSFNSRHVNEFCKTLEQLAIELREIGL